MTINGAQLHLLVNHLPVVGFIGVVLALFVTLFIESRDIKRFVLLSTIVVGLSALAPYWTGEPAEDVIENSAGFNKELVHDHEELAEKATIFAVLTSALAAFVYWRQRTQPIFLSKGIKIVLIFSLISAVLMAAAAHEGGKIQHPEIRET